jgi:hypothetical protein
MNEGSNVIVIERMSNLQRQEIFLFNSIRALRYVQLG